MKYDTIVIGAGLFGSCIARALKNIDQDVLVLDDAQEGRGSKPAACLMKPSWLGGMKREDRDRALGWLDAAYGVQDLSFKVSVGSAKAHWVPPRSILAPWGVVRGTVTLIREYDRGWEVYYASGMEVAYCRKVVVAAGVWSDQVLRCVTTKSGPKGCLPPLQVAAQAGLASLYYGTQVEPTIRPWAPYKQLVKFNRGDGAWCGDGTAIKAANWDSARTEQVARREDLFVHGLGGPLPGTVRLFGLRPYVKEMGGNPAYLQEHAPGLWVATGGAKNGTIGAAWCATELAGRFA